MLSPSRALQGNGPIMKDDRIPRMDSNAPAKVITSVLWRELAQRGGGFKPHNVLNDTPRCGAVIHSCIKYPIKSLVRFRVDGPDNGPQRLVASEATRPRINKEGQSNFRSRIFRSRQLQPDFKRQGFINKTLTKYQDL